MKQVPVILLGVGGVGRALLRQLQIAKETIAARNQIGFSIVAVVDSRSWLFNAGGLAQDWLQEILAAKEAGRPLPEGKARPEPDHLLKTIHAAGLRQAIVVDVTAQDGFEPLLDRALELDYGVVLANKKALAGPWAVARAYYDVPRLRHESTVGGGQPVIATLRTLMDIGDKPIELSGQLSGTLGYLAKELDRGIPFSQAVAAARGRGYTEPDPREDLSGQDVMRKVLILARMAGWPLEPAAIEVESLYPAEMASLSVPDFMLAIARLDEEMAARVAAARAAGQVVRYVGSVTAAGGRVGLIPLPVSSPLANLKYISLRTGLYDDEPLLIAGKGAGVEMTAGGVLGDMIALAREVLA